MSIVFRFTEEEAKMVGRCLQMIAAYGRKIQTARESDGQGTDPAAEVPPAAPGPSSSEGQHG